MLFITRTVASYLFPGPSEENGKSQCFSLFVILSRQLSDIQNLILSDFQDLLEPQTN